MLSHLLWSFIDAAKSSATESCGKPPISSRVYSNSVSHRRLVIDKCASDGSVRTDDDDRTGTDVRKTFVVFAGAFGCWGGRGTDHLS